MKKWYAIMDIKKQVSREHANGSWAAVEFTPVVWRGFIHAESRLAVQSVLSAISLLILTWNDPGSFVRYSHFIKPPAILSS